MKDFDRDNMLFSLCGLNCGLCPMHLGNYCPGCGGGDGNQGCPIARCSLEHNKVEYCFQCDEFPCDKYDGIDEYDSFITHRNQKSDLRKAAEVGIDSYNTEQLKKIEILKYLLKNYNDGRRKTFYCMAVNLLDLYVIEDIIKQVENNVELNSSTMKEKSVYVVELFRYAAGQKNIELKLRKKG
ncbi:MAG TPA: hypothetical protein DEF04_10310 [Clostridiales bacterium]|nr:hypothetical protein [Clostridiales bacterium]